jgi:hypothetical protein
MIKEYDIVYCKECNAVKITDSDKACLICNGTSEVIGFEHKVIQDILEVELLVEDSNG